MSTNKKVVFADGKAFGILGYVISEKRVRLHYSEPSENLSGFIICDEAGNTIQNCSDFIYRWDVVDQKENVIYYTNDPNYRQTEPWPDLSDIPEQAEPLTNEELTEAVADLMYDVSAAQLGL